MIPLKNQAIFYESSIINFILYKTPIISNSTKNYTTAISEVYDLGSNLSKKEISVEEANKKSLAIMLRYSIVDKSTVENLIKLHKLDNINNIESIINNNQ